MISGPWTRTGAPTTVCSTGTLKVCIDSCIIILNIVYITIVIIIIIFIRRILIFFLFNYDDIYIIFSSKGLHNNMTIFRCYYPFRFIYMCILLISSIFKSLLLIIYNNYNNNNSTSLIIFIKVILIVIIIIYIISNLFKIYNYNNINYNYY